jgi:hypothetical protein
MSIYALDIGWAETANDLRYLQWELLACEEIRGVFPDGGRRHADGALRR